MARPKPTKEEALRRLLARCEPDGECLIWPGAVSGFGYPVANLNGRGTFTYLHVEVHKQYVGEVPVDFKVDHICNRPRCLSYLHLQAIPHGENVARGGAGQHRRYDPTEALRLKQQGLTNQQIADKLGVSRTSILNALKEIQGDTSGVQ